MEEATEAKQLESEADAPVDQKKRRIVTWTPEEDDILREQIRTLGTGNWPMVASKFKDKSTRQCRRRWFSYLSTDFKRGGWSLEEDNLLCKAQQLYGNRWTEIAKVLSGRTDNAVKNRFTTLCRKMAKNKESGKENSKRPILSDDDFGCEDLESPSKKLRAAKMSDLLTRLNNGNTSDKDFVAGKQQPRPPFTVLSQNILKIDASQPQSQVNALETSTADDRKTEGAFLKKNDPKILALMQQAELLSSLAMKVNTEKTEQSLDNAWKVLENFLSKSKHSDAESSPFKGDFDIDHFNDLLKDLRSSIMEIQPSQRQPGLHDSPSSSEYSSRSALLSTNANEKMAQSQSETCTLHNNDGTKLQTPDAKGENTVSIPETKIAASETTNQEEISVHRDEPKNEDVSTLSVKEFSSPQMLTPLFKSLAATVPSPEFSESERHFLMKTFGIESPAPEKSTNPSEPPSCRRALVHSL